MKSLILLLGFTKESGWEVLGEIENDRLSSPYFCSPNLDLYIRGFAMLVYDKLTTEVVRYNKDHFIIGA